MSCPGCLGDRRVPAHRRVSRPVPTVEAIHRPLDQILDVNVRDGLVYYRALKAERGRLDRYVASLNVTAGDLPGWSSAQQMAFWVNAYNAFVLQTVINHYPLKGSPEYPLQHPQIPGAFDKTQAPRGGADADARRDREDDPAGVQGAAAVPGARTRRRRQRPAAQRGLHRRAAEKQLDAVAASS